MECDGEAQSDVKLALRHTAMTRGGPAQTARQLSMMPVDDRESTVGKAHFIQTKGGRGQTGLCWRSLQVPSSLDL
jgi:hypothetical protein